MEGTGGTNDDSMAQWLDGSILLGESMRDRKGLGCHRLGEGGFTLVELIVVIAIITLLVALIVVLMIGVTEKARYAKAHAIVRMLDEGCMTYKLDFGVFPPNDKGDSRCFHFYLGRERILKSQRVEPGTPELQFKKPPIIEFPTDMLRITSSGPPNPTQPVPIIDPWENVIRYKSPGSYNKKGVDIWSPGKNGRDELVETDPKFDDVCNWVKEY